MTTGSVFLLEVLFDDPAFDTGFAAGLGIDNSFPQDVQNRAVSRTSFPQFAQRSIESSFLFERFAQRAPK